MKVEIHCSKCGSTLSVPADRGGEFITCSSCRHSVLIPLLPGKELGGYRIVRHLGTGGMGSVYLAEQTAMGRDVALKILAPELTRDERFRSRFEKEIRLQAALNHPNIATAYDAGHDGPLHYLAMEYMEGHSLDEMIQNQGPFSEKKALRIIRKVAVGLSYAWKTASLIHRDIKPSNIMISEDGKVKVLDMGVSKSMKNKEGEEDSSNLIVGTPRYMPPEQMRGYEQVDHRADIYALGATLYHMLTGQAPFPLHSVAEVVEAQAAGPAPSPRSFNPDISANCVHLVRVMMAAKPENRYPFWSSLIADISRVLSGQKPLAGIPAKEDSLVASSSSRPPDKQLKINAEELKNKSRSAHAQKPLQDLPNRSLLVLVGLLIFLAVILFVVDSSRNQSAKPQPVAEAGTEKQTVRSEPVQQPASKPKPKPEQNRAKPDSPPSEADLPQLEDLYSFITNRMAVLPDRFSDHEEAIEQLKSDAKSLGYSRYLLLAEDLQKKLSRRKADVQKTLMADLQTRAEELWKKGKYSEAARVWNQYQGPLAQETQAARTARAQEYVKRDQDRIRVEKEKIQKAEAAVQRLAELCSGQILSGADLSQAEGAVQEALTVYQQPEIRDRMMDIAAGLKEIQHMGDRILDQYRGSMDQVVTLETVRGAIPVQVIDVTNGILYVERQLEQGSLGMMFKADDLTQNEKLLRLGKISDRYTSLRMAVLAYRGGQTDRALSYLENDDTLIGSFIKKQLEKAVSSSVEASPESLPDPKALSPVDTLKQDLISMNPHYRGGGEFRLKQGQVTAVNLQNIDGDIENLSPLRGLPLKYVSLQGPYVIDLEPLQDMPIETLILLNTGIHSLEALKGMNLIRLSLQGSEGITNLSHLTGMPLKALDLRGTKVSSLRAVQEAPLTSLMLSDQFRETGEFEHFPLAYLDISGSRITSLEGLTNMPLKFLQMMDVPIHDVRPLANLPLEQIRFEPQRIHLGLDTLRAIPSLKKLADTMEGDYLPAEVFWGRYDRGFDHPESGLDPSPAD